MKTTSENSQAFARRQSWRTLTLAVVMMAGMAGAVSLARWIDSSRPSLDPRTEAEQLYLAGKTVRRLSLGFNGPAA